MATDNTTVDTTDTPTPAPEGRAADAPAPAEDPTPAGGEDRGNPNHLVMTREQLDELVNGAADRAAASTMERLQGGSTGGSRIEVSAQERAARGGAMQGLDLGSFAELSREGRLMEVARNGYGESREAKIAITAEYLKHKLLGRWYASRASVPYDQCISVLAGDTAAIKRALDDNHAPDHMIRALTTGNATAGAELVSTEQVRELIVNLQHIAEFRRFVRVFTMEQNSVDFGKYTKGKSAHYRGELTPHSPNKAAGEPTGNLILTAKTLIAQTEQISREMFADFRAGDLMDFIAEDLAEDIAQKEAEVFTVGAGTTVIPQGIHDAEAGFTTINQEGAAPTYDDIVTLRRSVPKPYRRQRRGMTSDGPQDPDVGFATGNAGLALLEKIKDENGQPYYKAATADEEFDRFAGYPIFELPDTPGEGVEEDPTYLTFGNFRKAYLWGDRQTLEIESTMEANDNYDDHSMQVKGTTRNDGKPRETVALVHMGIWKGSSGS